MVGRFQVMAVLQAARAEALGESRDEAESFGLNRAIFYAAAKRGFKGKREGKVPGEAHHAEQPPKQQEHPIQEGHVGKETAYYVQVHGKKRYVMGDEIQQPEDFQRQIARRFGAAFPQAWEQAVQIVSQVDRAILESQRKFYDEVYLPRRDDLAHAWSALTA